APHHEAAGRRLEGPLLQPAVGDIAHPAGHEETHAQDGERPDHLEPVADRQVHRQVLRGEVVHAPSSNGNAEGPEGPLRVSGRNRPALIRRACAARAGRSAGDAPRRGRRRSPEGARAPTTRPAGTPGSRRRRRGAAWPSPPRAGSYWAPPP